MNKLLITSILVMFTTACQPESKQLDYEFKLPKSLSHCEVHSMTNGKMTRLYVVYCPNATTTTSYDYNGKGDYIRTTLVSE